MKPPTCSRCQTAYTIGAREISGRGRGAREFNKYPLLLYCGHSFCQPCLRKCQTSQDVIQCPKCQETSRQSLKDISPDVYTVGLLWSRRLELEHQSEKISSDDRMKGRPKPPSPSDAGKQGTQCSECHKSAHCRCLTCETVLCQPCFHLVHSKSACLTKHQPTPLPDSGALDERFLLRKKMRSKYCPSHEKCPIEYFCNQDNHPVCSRCVVMGDHKGHDVQTLEDKNKVSLKEMEPAILTVQETLWRLGKAEQVIQQAMPMAQVDSKKLVEEVRLHFQGLHSLLQAREERLVQEVMETAANISSPFLETQSFLQNEKAMLESDLMDAARAMQGSIHTLVDADLILERLRRAKDIPCMATVVTEAMAFPVIFSSVPAVEDTIRSYGIISTLNAAQMFTLSVPGPDAPKPPAEELPGVPEVDVVSTDNDSPTDSMSVTVEEEREEAQSLLSDATSEQLRTELMSDRPGKHMVVGHSEKIRVTHIRTPAQFYVQLTSGRGELETMQRHINQYCRSQHGSRDAQECLDPGTLVLAQFSQDKNWYRAVIINNQEPGEGEDKGGGSYEVFFMDYGNMERVTRSKLRPMNKKFESHPAFAYECALYGVLPADQEQGWTTQSVQVILDMTCAGTVIMKVMEEGIGALAVDLIKPETQKQCVDSQPTSLRDTLLFLHLAVPSSFTPSPPPGGTVKNDYISLSKAVDGQVMDVVLCHVETPSLFFVQGSGKSSSQYLHQLTTTMQDVYSGDSGQRYTIFCPRLGMMCVARYPRDDHWYRAQVTGLPGDGSVQVYFVDYGNTQVLPHTHIRKILQDHVKFPRQAIECSVVDVEPTGNGQWSEEALAWFRMTAELQFAQIRVVGHCDKANKVAGVLYLISQDNQLCSINMELVERGFANSTGLWSQRGSFEGITLQPDPAAAMLSPSSSSSPSPTLKQGSPSPVKFQGPPPTSQTTPPRKARPSPGKGEKCTTPSARSRKSRISTLSNQHGKQEQAGMEEKALEEEAAELKSVGVEVVITGYRSPAHFFIQLQEKQSELLSLMTEVASYETEPAPDGTWERGDYCVAKYSKDERWYRARIASVLEDGAYEVHLLDYGHVDTLHASQLRTLKKVDGEKECFAERCHLVDLAPAGSMDRSQWSATAINFMADEIRAKRLFLKLEGNTCADQGLPVDILIEKVIPESALEPLRHEYISLVTRLQERGLAIPFGKSGTRMPDLGGSQSFHSKQGQSPTESASTSTPTAGGVDQVDGREKNHTPSSEEMAQIIQADCHVQPHPPPASSSLTVSPVYISTQGVIYAHDCQDEDLCTAFMEKIDLYAKTQAPRGHLQVKVGQLCLAYYNSDDYWYRARVLEVGQSHVKVKYIDYGNTERLERSLLRMIPPELCEKHQMAYEFKLHNLKPETVDGSWPSSFLEYMENQLVNRKCTAIVKGNRDGVPVGVDLLFNEGDSMSNTLLQMGVVSKENIMDDFYERTADISNILQHSNPYFPLRPGEAGTVFNGLVTHMELPNLVYIQRCAACTSDSLPEDLARFAQMMEDLNHKAAQAPPLKEVPSQGEMCCAQYSRDNCWFRALVAKTYSYSQSALVFYVDYGNSEDVTLDRLRALPTQFQDMPAQAMRAFLNLDLPPGANRWTLATFQAMSAAILDTRHVVLIKFTEPLTVELFSEEDQQKGVAALTYQRLIDNGLVVIPKPVMAVEEGDNVIVESNTEESNSEVD